MKVLSVNGSPRKKGNTHIMLDRVCDALSDTGADVREVYLHGMDLSPCGACMQCMEINDGHCHGVNDDCDELIELTRGADVILLGSPVYFGSVTGQIKAYMDRVGFVSRVSDGFLRRKIGAAVVPARRAGELFTFAQLNMWFLINGMVVPGSTYWNVGHALKEGEIMNDTEALSTLDELARNILWLANAMGK